MFQEINKVIDGWSLFHVYKGETSFKAQSIISFGPGIKLYILQPNLFCRLTAINSNTVYPKKTQIIQNFHF